MNKARERRPYSAGDKIPESTGDKLQDLLGIRIPLSWGNLQTVLENDSIGVSVFRRGTILDQDCRGCLLMNAYTPLGNVAILSYSAGS